jgi:peptide/nickel transport system substrate-binding protein
VSNKKLSWRKFMGAIAVVVVATLMLTACGTPQTAPTVAAPTVAAPTKAPTVAAPTAAPTAVPTKAPTAAPAKVLTLINPVFDKDWSPLRGGGWYIRLTSLWWAAPVWADMKGELHPSVFASWSASPDFKVWTFKIEPKAKFSDGSPITAEDVKGTWELCTQPGTKHQRVSLFFSGIVGYDDAVAGKKTTLPGIVAKDASTVEVSLITPDPIFVNRIATHLISPVKISQARGADGQEVAGWWDAKNKPAVSGPFMPVSMDLNKGTLEFARNPNWFGAAPKLDKIKIISVEDGATALLMVKKGEADINMSNDLPTTYDEVGAGYVGTGQPAVPVLQYFWMNPKIAPLDDINCRKALIMAANPVEMFKASHPHGPGEPGTTLLKQLLRDKETNKPETNNPEGAKAALAQCKYKGAMPKLYVAGASNPQAVAAAQVLIEQWRQVLGIKETEMIQAYDSLSKADQAKVQFFRDDVGTRVFDAATMLLNSIHSKSGNAQSKMGGYKNDQVDKLIDEALTLSPSDPNRNLKALEAEKLAMAEYMWIPWYDEGPLMHAMPWVKGLTKNVDWQIERPWELDIVK